MPQQRKVLGRVSSSRLNIQRSSPTSDVMKSRMSMGPGTTFASRQSLGGSSIAAKAKSKRMSMMPSMTSRRQSTATTVSAKTGGMRRKSVATVGGSSGTGGLKSDPRPLGDKAFIRQSIENLIEFLTERNYDQAISPKILFRPTGKDFENVALFLFSLLDPRRKIPQQTGKFADDFTVMLKGLRYPFNISKTSLAAVGSPHTWPTLLASLTWLVELLEYDDMTGLSSVDMDSPNDDEELDIDRLFFVYLRKAYECFLCGDDERFDELDSELREKVKSRDVEIEEALVRLKRKYNSLEEQYKDEASMPSLLPELEQRKRDFQSDRLKWEKLIRQFEENKEIMIAKVREREAEGRAKEAELEHAQRQKAAIQRALNEQELSPQDAERMNLERRQLDQAQNVVLEQRDTMQKQIWDMEMAISKRVQHIEESIETYNQIAKSLKLVQANSENPGERQGANILLRLDHSQDTIVCVSSHSSTNGHAPDVNKIRSALEDLQEMSAQKTHQIRTENMELRVKVEENEELQSGLRDEIRALEQQLEQVEKQYQQEKTEMENQLAQRANEMELVEEEIHKLQNEGNRLKEPLEKARDQINQLKVQLEKEETDTIETIQQLDDDLHQAVDYFCTFKENVANQLKELEQQLEHNLEATKQFCTSEEARFHQLATA